MNAEQHLVGLGIIFPELADTVAGDATYYAVRPDWQREIDPSEEDDLPPDSEGDARLREGTELQEAGE